MSATAVMDKHRRGAFLISEANGTRSREVGTIAAGDFKAGTLMEGVGTFNALTAPPNVTGILFEGINVAHTRRDRTVMVRDCEVHQQEIVFPAAFTAPDIDMAITQLATLGIVVLNSNA